MFPLVLVGLAALTVVILLFPALRGAGFVAGIRRKRRVNDMEEYDPVVSEDARRIAVDRERGGPGDRRSGRRVGYDRVNRGDRKVTRKSAGGPREPKYCPVCRAQLAAGERIKSVVYQGGVQHGTVTEYTTHIFGCPHCYPANRGHPRICPVCSGEVNRDGHLIARMFEKPGAKKHVRVLGCTACRENRRR